MERKDFIQLLVGTLIGTLLIVAVLCMRIAPVYEARLLHQTVADAGAHTVQWPSKFLHPVASAESVTQH